MFVRDVAEKDKYLHFWFFWGRETKDENFDTESLNKSATKRQI